MNRKEWQEEYKRLKEKPLAPYLIGAGFTADEVENVPARTLGELSGLNFHSDVETTEQLIKQRQVSYLAQKITFLPEIAECALNGEWEEFSSKVQAFSEVMPEAFTYFYDDMPEEYRRDFVIGCYQHHGDSVEECREAVAELRNNGRDELPEEYRDVEELTVYRAGEEPIDEAQDFFSWTLDKQVACFFKDRFPWESRHLYRAKIRPADVIAYTDEREEREVIQYWSVYDVEEIEALDE